jgi:hypothetical protein
LYEFGDNPSDTNKKYAQAFVTGKTFAQLEIFVVTGHSKLE